MSFGLSFFDFEIGSRLFGSNPHFCDGALTLPRRQVLILIGVWVLHFSVIQRSRIQEDAWLRIWIQQDHFDVANVMLRPPLLTQCHVA